MGKSHRASFTMRFLGMSLLAIVLAATVHAEDFTKEKIQLGKKKCLCDFSLDVADKCKGTAKCDKKCSGSGEVEIGGCSFTLVVKKGKGKISKCSCKTATTAAPTTGETPVPMTGSGSGETPVPITGSGSEEPPMPITGSGAPPAGGEGMQCSCKCDCPDGSGECDCDCNCPMTSKAVNCAPGFSKVCPMVGDACPQDMEPICPNNAMSRMAGGAGDGHVADKGCQCVPDFLMDMVMIQPLAPAGRMTAVDRAMTKATIQVGKKKCKCSYEMNAKDCKKSKITCDKKCSGKASGVELEDGMYMLDIAVKKGKVTIAKCDVQAAPAPTGTGGGSGGGMGSGSGSGGGGMGGIGSRCACVSSDMGGTGPVTPTGSGSGTVTTGSGSGPATLLPPTGSGSGSGSTGPPTTTQPPQNVVIPQRSWMFQYEWMTPIPSPIGDAPYIPGTPGSQWTNKEVLSTRLRVLQMIHPSWTIRKHQGTWNGVGGQTSMGQVTENTLMRLAFHDCVLNVDGTGGCDGCMDWKNMNKIGPSANGPKEEQYTYEPVTETDNNGMDQITAKLELIYSTIDWPFQNSSLEISLQQSGKSRADLWELAGLVALERTIERANRACDLDFHARQQVTLLESREACEIKLTKPLKFLTGRSDCISEDPEGRGYVNTKPEDQNLMFGDAKHILDFGRDVFSMDAVRWTALQAIHGVVHMPANLGIKYTWFGSGYLSNMYFKLIANHPSYRFVEGGDLSFGSASEAANIFHSAVGDPEGNPVAQTGWRASCMMAWNTTEGGPCFLRPTPPSAFDSPNPHKMATNQCVEKNLDTNGTCVIKNRSRCKDTWCDANNVQHGAYLENVAPEVVGPWTENATDQQQRHSSGWNNQFAFPWEIGLYWNISVGGIGQRAVGCPGLDTPFGTVAEPNWPFKVANGIPIFASPAMDCNLNTDAPDGKPMHQVVDELASDNEYFAEMFLEGWQLMTSNGYTAGQLRDGPHGGWMGHYSLQQQGVQTGDFEEYIRNNAPVTFTDTNADPYVCGHRGHAMVSCGNRFAKGFAAGAFEGPGDEGPAF